MLSGTNHLFFRDKSEDTPGERSSSLAQEPELITSAPALLAGISGPFERLAERWRRRAVLLHRGVGFPFIGAGRLGRVGDGLAGERRGTARCDEIVDASATRRACDLTVGDSQREFAFDVLIDGESAGFPHDRVAGKRTSLVFVPLGDRVASKQRAVHGASFDAATIGVARNAMTVAITDPVEVLSADVLAYLFEVYFLRACTTGRCAENKRNQN